MIGAALLATLPVALAIPRPRSSHPPTLHFGACNPKWVTNPALTCASLEVPLDYHDPHVGTAKLAIAKLSATGTKKGTIFFNPGGPGNSGLLFLDGPGGAQLVNQFGGTFDIVSWDPRGTGFSDPSTNCFKAPGASQIFLNDLSNNASFIIPSAGPRQEDIDAFLGKTPAVEGVYHQFVQDCIANNGDALKFIGTAATTRDLVEIADAVQGEGHPINYYGISYGSVIGAHLMKLFPDRLGYIALDGIVDSIAFTSKFPIQVAASTIQDAFKAFNAYFDSCAAIGPPPSADAAGCALAVPGANGDDIEARLDAFLDAVFQVAQVAPGAFSNLNTFGFIQGIATKPELWHQLSLLIVGAEQQFQNATAAPPPGAPVTRRHLKQLLTGYSKTDLWKRQTAPPKKDPVIDDKDVSAEAAIVCVDGPDPGHFTTHDVFNEVIRITKDVSDLLGPTLPSIPFMYCHLWPVRSVERVPITPDISIPGSVLIIGNSADAITPFANAKALFDNIHAGGTKRLVQHDAPAGHTSLELRSACTEDILRRFFQEGWLPHEDTLCGINEKPEAFFPVTDLSDENIETKIISAPLSTPTSYPSKPSDPYSSKPADPHPSGGKLSWSGKMFAHMNVPY